MTGSDASIQFESAFVDILAQYPVVFDKSQLPSIKKQKSDAFSSMRQTILEKFNMNITEKQVSKKLRNMKTRLKTKLDNMRIGNKKIKLKPWEKKLYQTILQEENNPSVSRIKGKQIYFSVQL